MKWIKSQIWEIERSPLLCYFAAIVAQVHVMTYFHWMGSSRIENLNICWDFYPECSVNPLLPDSLKSLVLGAYLVFGCLSLLLFLWRRFVATAWTFFFITTTAMIWIYAADAQLQNSVHSITLMLSLALLFVPNKAQLIRFTLLISYLLSAFGKASSDWLSGAGLQGIIHLPLKGLEWVAAFALLLEMATPVLLLSRTVQLLFAGIGILLSYHIAHFAFFRDFASVALSLYLVYFVLEYFELGRLERENYYQSYELPEPSKLWWPIAGISFVLAQLPAWPQAVPVQLFHVENSHRVTECRYIAFASNGTTREQVILVPPEDVSSRYKCHESVGRHVAQEWCRANAKDETELRFHLMRRGLGQADYHEVYKIGNACAAGKGAKL